MSKARKPWGWGTFIGIGITLVWLGAMAHLVKNHLVHSGDGGATIAATDAEPELTKDWRDVEEHMLLKLGSRTIGAFSMTVRQTTDTAKSSYRADFRLGAQLRIGPLTRPVEMAGLGLLDKKLNLQALHVTGNLAGLPLGMTGMMIGNVLMLQSQHDGQLKRAQINMGREVSLLDAVRPAALRGFQIKEGNSLRIPVVDPFFSMERGVAEIRVKAEEKITVNERQRDAYRVETTLNDFVSTTWVDRQGTTLKRQLFGNLSMERATEEDARAKSPVISQEMHMPPFQAAEFRDVPLQDVGTALGPNSSLLSLLSGSSQGR